MRKITGVFVTAFVFLLGLVGIASGEQIPGRPSANRLKNQNLEMKLNRGKVQNLGTQTNRLKVQDLDAKKRGTTDQTKAVDMFGKHDETGTSQR